jgi:hypothetical protein
VFLRLLLVLRLLLPKRLCIVKSILIPHGRFHLFIFIDLAPRESHNDDLLLKYSKVREYRFILVLWRDYYSRVIGRFCF